MCTYLLRMLFLLLLFFAPGYGVATVGAAEPAEIKAAFLTNFARFTTRLEDEGQLLTICFPSVAEPVGSAMVRRQDAVEKGGRLLVRRGVELHSLPQCGIVYLSDEDAYRLGEIITELHKGGVLTVSDQRGFTASGGMIELFAEGNKYRFMANLDAVKTAGLKINARILALARDARGSDDR